MSDTMFGLFVLGVLGVVAIACGLQFRARATTDGVDVEAEPPAGAGRVRRKRPR